MTTRRPIRVLIAEDNDLVRALLSELIAADEGLELAGAVTDAASAIELTAAERPDVVILDVRMPGGGVAAARGIRELALDTKVIGFSAHDDPTTRDEMLGAGAAVYLLKGGSIETLIETIRATIDRPLD